MSPSRNVFRWLAPAVLLATLAAATMIPARAVAQGQMTGIRAMGMGEAFTAGASGTGALFHNPAGISALMMYSVEASYLYDQTTGMNVLHASIVDGKSNPMLGGGIGYTFSVSPQEARVPDFTGHDIYGGLAVPVLPGWIILGATAHYLDYSQLDQDLANGITVDVGVLVSLGDFVAIGMSGRNLIDVENSGREREAAFGLAYRDRSTTVSGGTELTFGGEDPIVDLRLGFEHLLGQRLPLRIGYQRTGADKHHVISGGVGWRSQLLGVDAVYRQDLNLSEARMFGLAIDLYL